MPADNVCGRDRDPRLPKLRVVPISGFDLGLIERHRDQLLRRTASFLRYPQEDCWRRDRAQDT